MAAVVAALLQIAGVLAVLVAAWQVSPILGLALAGLTGIGGGLLLDPPRRPRR